MKIFKPISFFLATLLIYLAPPLIGWGLNDLPGFFTLAPRLTYATAVVLAAAAVGCQSVIMPEAFNRSQENKEQRVARQSIVRWGLIVMMYTALIFIPFADRRAIGVLPENPALRWFGAVFFAAGLGLIVWSGWVLSRQYSPEVTLQENHQLITNGLYRFIRHPRYLGVILMALGISLTFRSWIGLIAAACVVPVILFRIRDEERLMQAAFGQEWTAYCAHSWRLLPYIY